MMRIDRQHVPLASRIVSILTGAFLVGLLSGVTAQFVRQIVGPLMVVGAGIAPWLTIGFVLAVWATRRSRSLRNAGVLGAGTMGAYLLAWLISYHGLFALRESVGLFAAWREALPWLVAVGPVCLVLGLVAALSHKGGILGDVCLALPIAWSLPEVIESLEQGWSNSATVAIPIAALAVLPLVTVGRRDVSPVRVVFASVMLGGVALAFVPIVLSQIHS
jgi:hypothetical protein